MPTLQTGLVRGGPGLHCKRNSTSLLSLVFSMVSSIRPFRFLYVHPKKMKIKEIEGGRISVPVTTLAPAACLGSGVGSAHVAKGNYDMTSDPETVKKFKLDKKTSGRIFNIFPPNRENNSLDSKIADHLEDDDLSIIAGGDLIFYDKVDKKIEKIARIGIKPRHRVYR